MGIGRLRTGRARAHYPPPPLPQGHWRCPSLFCTQHCTATGGGGGVWIGRQEHRPTGEGSSKAGHLSHKSHIPHHATPPPAMGKTEGGGGGRPEPVPEGCRRPDRVQTRTEAQGKESRDSQGQAGEGNEAQHGGGLEGGGGGRRTQREGQAPRAHGGRYKQTVHQHETVLRAHQRQDTCPTGPTSRTMQHHLRRWEDGVWDVQRRCCRAGMPSVSSTARWAQCCWAFPNVWLGVVVPTGPLLPTLTFVSPFGVLMTSTKNVCELAPMLMVDG